MKIVIPGGSGQVGQLLSRAFRARGDEVVILSRTREPDCTYWDGETLGEWAAQLDGADVVINLAGRTVNCRYSEKNLQEMMDSRVLSTRVVARRIAPTARLVADEHGHDLFASLRRSER
jgi:uncharacterized protein